jgi:hypothetical protein
VGRREPTLRLNSAREKGQDMDPQWRGPARGLIVAQLRKSDPDCIVLGDSVLFLRHGMTCNYAIGTNLKVLYTELKNGRRNVDEIRSMTFEQ